jgi:hypothetical protein
MSQMQPFRRWIDPLLQTGIVEASANRNARTRLNYSLALLPQDPNQLTWLKEYVLSAAPEDVMAIRQVFLLRQERAEIVNALRQHLETFNAATAGDTNGAPSQVPSGLAAASIMAQLDQSVLNSTRLGDALVAELIAAEPAERSRWVDLLRPANTLLIAAAERAAADANRSVEHRVLAEDLLNSFRRQSPRTLNPRTQP